MPIVFRCPACNAELTLSDAAAGRRGKCPHCKGDIIVPSAGAAAPSPPPQAGAAFTPKPPGAMPPSALPLPQGPYGSAAPLEPHRGTTIQVLGILSLVVLPIVLGPLAWIWGRQDLRKMDEGVMDPLGRGATQTGKICGMIATIISFGGIAVTGVIMFSMFCCCGAGLFVPSVGSSGSSTLSTNISVQPAGDEA